MYSGKRRMWRTWRGLACGVLSVLALGWFVAGLHGQEAATQTTAAGKPTLFLIGDSTVKNGAAGMKGWGEVIGRYFDKSRINVENHAIGGRSSRTFFAEGRWDKVLEKAKPGDFVLIQFGHNDGAAINDAKARGSLRGLGEETQEIDNQATKKHEVVHTYGWYMRKYISDAKARGMTPIVCSPVAHLPKQQEPVKPGEVEKSPYVPWSEEIAKDQKALFISLNQRIMAKYAGTPISDLRTQYFTGPTGNVDGTHTNPAGADLNAACVVEGLRDLKECPLAGYLLATPEPMSEPKK